MKRVVYYVEGKTEEKLLTVLKTKYQNILPGTVVVFNPINEIITPERLRRIKPNTDVVLLFDTDEYGKNLEVINSNIKKLKKCSHVGRVLTVTQCENLEDELCYSTDIKTIKELTGSRVDRDFKRDLCNIREENLYSKLKNFNFSIDKLWSRDPKGVFRGFKNQGAEIKKK